MQTEQQQILSLFATLEPTNIQLALALADGLQLDLEDIRQKLIHLVQWCGHYAYQERYGVIDYNEFVHNTNTDRLRIEVLLDRVKQFVSNHDQLVLQSSYLKLPQYLPFLSGTKTIELNHFKKFPQALAILENSWEALFVNNCKVRKMPLHLKVWDKLHSILFSACTFTQVMDQWAELDSLESLAIVRTDMKRLDKNWTKISSLKKLILRGNQLEYLPESIGQLKHLTYLDLSHNNLTSLPESIAELTSLKTLNLSYNQLRSLPKSIGKLSNLEILHINNNELSDLPESFAQLRLRDKSLNLNYNHFERLPIVIEALKNIDTVKIQHNKLKRIDENFACLKALNLKSFSYEYNPFLKRLQGKSVQQYFPDDFFDGAYAKYLNPSKRALETKYGAIF